MCTYSCRYFLDNFPMETLPCRLPPSENGEWWEIGDESRGGIPYYYHTKTGETVWEKPNGFVIPLTVLQVRALSRSSIPTDFKPPLTRIPRWADVYRRRFLQTQIRVRPHVQRHKINVPGLNDHVHIRRKLEVPHRLLGLQAVLPLQRRRAQLLPLCDATILLIPITQRPRAWRQRFHPSLAQRRAPRQRPPPLTVLLSLLVNHRSRWLLLSSV